MAIKAATCSRNLAAAPKHDVNNTVSSLRPAKMPDYKSWILLLLWLDVASAAQPEAPPPVAAPLRELPWGQLNFLHTTGMAIGA